MPEEYELKQAAIRLVETSPLYSKEKITCPEDAVRILAKELRTYDREVFCVVNLRSDNAPINFNICSMGAVNACIAHPREVMKSAVLSNAASIIVIHNHPSGSLTPSRFDFEVTDRLTKACDIMEIPLTDHIIIGAGNSGNYFSFKENKILDIKPEKKEKLTEMEMSNRECFM